MRQPFLFTLAALLFGLFSNAPTSLAQPAGFQLFGHRDFEMDGIQQQDGKAMRLRYLAARRILRMEMLDGSGQALLINFAQGDMLLLIADGQRGVFGRRDAAISSQRVVPADATRDIAGEKCREASINGSPACIADDGVPLMLAGPQGEFVAQRVLRQPQSPALFTFAKEIKVQPLPGYNGPLPAAPF
ncbi:MAG: hypothetical protein J0L51_11755 [Rhizobiales bacterium]|nr:hypothetical protein [Hyphomicrobiales bacterium]